MKKKEKERKRERERKRGLKNVKKRMRENDTGRQKRERGSKRETELNVRV